MAATMSHRQVREVIVIPHEKREVALVFRPSEEGRNAEYQQSLYPKGVYVVMLDGVKIGNVYRRMFSRERKSKYNRYVSARWESLGWEWDLSRRHVRWRTECDTRRAAVEELIQFHDRGDDE